MAKKQRGARRRKNGGIGDDDVDNSREVDVVSSFYSSHFFTDFILVWRLGRCDGEDSSCHLLDRMCTSLSVSFSIFFYMIANYYVSFIILNIIC
jgi:hypothetical protein